MSEAIKVRKEVKSSVIESLVYEYEQQTLEVNYKRGKRKGQLRKFKKISKEFFEDLIASKSVGKRIRELSKKRKKMMSFFEKLVNGFWFQ
jgi:hypothetical protein